MSGLSYNSTVNIHLQQQQQTWPERAASVASYTHLYYPPVFSSPRSWLEGEINRVRQLVRPASLFAAWPPDAVPLPRTRDLRDEIARLLYGR